LGLGEMGLEEMGQNQKINKIISLLLRMSMALSRIAMKHGYSMGHGNFLDFLLLAAPF